MNDSLLATNAACSVAPGVTPLSKTFDDKVLWLQVAVRLALSVLALSGGRDKQVNELLARFSHFDVSSRTDCLKAASVLSQVASIPAVRYDRTSLDVLRTVEFVLTDATRSDSDAATVCQSTLAALSRASQAGVLKAVGPKTLSLLLLADSDGTLTPEAAVELAELLWDIPPG